jgi:hypothetical protein
MHNVLLPLPQCFRFYRPILRYKENGCVKSEEKQIDVCFCVV